MSDGARTRGVRRGAGRPSNDSTGATVSIFLGRDSEAKELRELGGHSFIPRIDRPWSQRIYYVKDLVSGGLRGFQSSRRRLR